MLDLILSFIRDPKSLVAPAIALAIGFSAGGVIGVVQGWNWSQAAQLRAHIEGLEKAAEQKEKLSEEDRKRAEAAEAELARSEATLESVLHENKMASCTLSPAELAQLRLLAKR